MATISSTFTDGDRSIPYSAAADNGNAQRADKSDEIPYEIRKISEARKRKKESNTSTAEEVTDAEQESSPGFWGTIRNGANTVLGRGWWLAKWPFSWVYRKIFGEPGSDSGQTSIMLNENFKAEVKKNTNDLLQDLGIENLTKTELSGRIKYDRNFKSKNRLADIEFMRMCKDPATLFQFFLLKLHDSRTDNCEKAFRAWIEENEKAKILAKKRHEISLQNAEKTESLTSASKKSTKAKFFGQIVSIAGTVLPPILTMAAGFFTGGTSVFVQTLGYVVIPLATLVNSIGSTPEEAAKSWAKTGDMIGQMAPTAAEAFNSKTKGEIETNRADIEQFNSLAENSRSEASMIAQDLSRLQQDLSSINNIMQQNADNRKNALSSIRIG